jgi:hypothetical protein
LVSSPAPLVRQSPSEGSFPLSQARQVLAYRIHEAPKPATSD